MGRAASLDIQPTRLGLVQRPRTSMWKPAGPFVSLLILPIVRRLAMVLPFISLLLECAAASCGGPVRIRSVAAYLQRIGWAQSDCLAGQVRHHVSAMERAATRLARVR